MGSKDKNFHFPEVLMPSEVAVGEANFSADESDAYPLIERRL